MQQLQPSGPASLQQPAAVGRQQRKWHVARHAAVGRQLTVVCGHWHGAALGHLYHPWTRGQASTFGEQLAHACGKQYVWCHVLQLQEGVVLQPRHHTQAHEQAPPNPVVPAPVSTVSVSQPQQAAAKQLTNRIKACTDWHQLRVLLAVHSGGDINPVHVTAAVHHCSNMVSRHGISGPERSALKKWLNSSMLPAAFHMHRGMGPRELVTILQALASMQHIPPVRWLAGHCQHMKQLLDNYTIRDTSSSLWALSKLLSLAQAEMLSPASTHHQAPQSSAATSSELGQGGAAYHRHYDALLSVTQQAVCCLMRRSLTQLHLANSQDLANLVLSAATLHHLGVQLDTSHGVGPAGSQLHPRPADDWASRGTTPAAGLHLSWATWKAAVLVESQHKLHMCEPQALANIAHGLSRLSAVGAPPAEAWRAAFSTAASRQLHHFCPQALTAVLSAHVPLGWQGSSSGWSGQLVEATQAVLMECSTQDLCDLGLSMPAVMRQVQGDRGPPACWLTHDVMSDWWRTYESVMVDRMRYATPAQLAILLLSLARARSQLQWQPQRNTLSSWFSAAQQQVPHFSTLDVAQVLAACCSLGVCPPYDFMQALVLVLRQGLPSCQLTQLSSSLRSLARLRYNPGWQFMLDMYSHTSTRLTSAATTSAAHHHPYSSISWQPAGAAAAGRGSSSPLHHQPNYLAAHRQSDTQQVLILGPPSMEGLLPSLPPSQSAVQSSPVDARELSLLIGGVAALGQRPLQAWAQALVSLLPQVLAPATRQLHLSSLPASGQQQHTSALADSLVTLSWGMLRTFIVPTSPALHHLIAAATAAVPQLAPARASLLLCCVARLVLNTAVVGGQGDEGRTTRQLPVTRRRRSKLLAVNWVRRAAPADSPAAGINTALSGAVAHQQQAADPSDAAGQLPTRPQYAPRRLRLLSVADTPSLKLSGVSRQARAAPAISQQQPVDALLEYEGGMTELLSGALRHCSPHLNRLNARELGAAVKSMRVVAKVAAVSAPYVQSHLGTWLVSWLQAHAARLHQAASDAGAGGMDWQVLGAVAHLVHLLGVQPEQPGKQSSKSQEDTAARQHGTAGELNPQLLPTLRTWLQCTMQAAHTAGQKTCPIAQLPAMVRLGQVCGQVVLVQPCVQASLLANQQQLMQQARLRLQPVKVRTKRAQQLARRNARLGLAPAIPPLLGPVSLLQLGYAVVASDAHTCSLECCPPVGQGLTCRQQGQQVVAAAALCVCLQKVLTSSHLSSRLLPHQAAAMGLLVRKLQPCQEQARAVNRDATLSSAGGVPTTV